MTHHEQTNDNENDEQSSMSTVSSVASVLNSLESNRRGQREERQPVVVNLTAADQPLPSSLSSSSSCVSEEGEVTVDSDTHTVDEDDEWSSGDVPPSSDEDMMIENDDEDFFYAADDTMMHHDLPAAYIVEHYHHASMQPTEEGAAHDMQQQVTSEQHGEQQTHNQNSTHPLLSADDNSANVAASLSPTSGGEVDDNGHVMCPICQEHVRFSDINHAPLAVSMLCGHMYHEQCLTSWVDTGKETCPTCRTTCQKRLIQRVYPEWCPRVTIASERKVNVTRSGDNNNTVHLADRQQQNNVSSSSSTELLTSRMLSVLRQTLAERDQLRTLGASLSDIVANRLTGMEQCLDRLFHETQEVGGVVSNQLGRLRRLFDDMRSERDHYRALCGELLALAKQLKSSNRAEPQTSEMLTQRLLSLCRKQSEQIEQLRLFADIEARSDDYNRADRSAPIFARLSAFDGVAETVDDNTCGSIQQLVVCEAVAVNNDQQQRAPLPLPSDTVLAKPETRQFFDDRRHADGDRRGNQRSFSDMLATGAGISSDEDEREKHECPASARCSTKRSTVSSIMQRYGFLDDAAEYDSIRKSSLVHANFDKSTKGSTASASENLKTTRVTVCDNTPYANTTSATRAVTSQTFGKKHHVKCDKLLSSRHCPTMNVHDDQLERQISDNNFMQAYSTDEESHHCATSCPATNAIRAKRNGVPVSSRGANTSHDVDKHDISISTPSANYLTTHSSNSQLASPISSSTLCTHISILSTDSDDVAAFGSDGDEYDSRILYRRKQDDNLQSTTTALRRQQLPSTVSSSSSRCADGRAIVRHVAGSSKKPELKKDSIERDFLYERIVERAQRAHDEAEKAVASSAVDSGRYCRYSDVGDE